MIQNINTTNKSNLFYDNIVSMFSLTLQDITVNTLEFLTQITLNELYLLHFSQVLNKDQFYFAFVKHSTIRQSDPQN